MDISLFPLPLIIVDYILGAIMWTLGARAVLDIFISPQNNIVFMNVLRQITNPIIRLFDKVTPKFLVPYMIPMYVAWWFYMIRFYVIPYIFFGEMGLLSFPMEGAVAQFLLNIF